MARRAAPEHGQCDQQHDVWTTARSRWLAMQLVWRRRCHRPKQQAISPLSLDLSFPVKPDKLTIRDLFQKERPEVLCLGAVIVGDFPVGLVCPAKTSEMRF